MFISGAINGAMLTYWYNVKGRNATVTLRYDQGGMHEGDGFSLGM
jgi:hypothetical protein